MKLNKIYCADCLVGLKGLPDKSVDLIIIDPPYGINYKSKYGSAKYKARVQNAQEWDKSFSFIPYFAEHWRVLADNSFMYVFGRFENYDVMVNKLKADRVLIWNKMHCGMGDLNGWGIGYEVIYMWKKGRPLLVGKRENGVINFKHVGYFEKTLHPTQKPVGLIELLIRKSSRQYDIVLDSFIGSGTTAEACLRSQRNFIGFEINKKYCDIANARINKYKGQTRL